MIGFLYKIDHPLSICSPSPSVWEKKKKTRRPHKFHSYNQRRIQNVYEFIGEGRHKIKTIAIIQARMHILVLTLAHEINGRLKFDCQFHP